MYHTWILWSSGNGNLCFSLTELMFFILHHCIIQNVTTIFQIYNTQKKKQNLSRMHPKYLQNFIQSHPKEHLSSNSYKTWNPTKHVNFIQYMLSERCLCNLRCTRIHQQTAGNMCHLWHDNLNATEPKHLQSRHVLDDIHCPSTVKMRLAEVVIVCSGKLSASWLCLKLGSQTSSPAFGRRKGWLIGDIDFKGIA